MITKATSSVSTMLETVETQLGIPSPLDMAKLATKSGAEETSGADETTAQEEVIYLMFSVVNIFAFKYI